VIEYHCRYQAALTSDFSPMHIERRKHQPFQRLQRLRSAHASPQAVKTADSAPTLNTWLNPGVNGNFDITKGKSSVSMVYRE
jgi:hypothetical protein